MTIMASSTSSPTSSSLNQNPQPPQPPQRSVARPVSNLGNTCYMNAVLQALAHAPELCLAMDCNPHHLTCPVAAENALRRKNTHGNGNNTPSPDGPSAATVPATTTSNEPIASIMATPPSSQSPGASGGAGSATTTSVAAASAAASAAVAPRSTRSSRRTAGTGSPATISSAGGSNTTSATNGGTTSNTTNEKSNNSNNGTVSVGGRKSPRTNNSNNNNDADSTHSDKNDNGAYEFCALCEVEQHIRQVHDTKQGKWRDKPLAPTTFVHGFMEHVAPWFALGVQEDSHEFLRLLIDAMQKSCQRARQHSQQTLSLQSQQSLNVETTAANPQDVTTTSVASSTRSGRRRLDQDAANTTTATSTATQSAADQDTEYPFSLFRGTVESNVVCGSCQAVSMTLDPIEDVGLEVTVPVTTATTSTNTTTTSSSTSSTRGGNAATATSTSSTSSRNASPIPSSQLADVQAAFSRFAQTEALDMGYKCEKCGKVGRATKQSRLASIPPILTLHLKRFRYGESRGMASASTGSGGGGGSGGAAPTRRSCRSEVSQLLGSNDFLGGKSGSAKIEGHVKFDMILDLQPYLTEELKAKHKSMFCRLFAVIVHAGKNSHSGHYIAFVRDVSQNEWWKMDDSRVTAVSAAEVTQAEAYMLLYRVVQHPVAVQLEEQHKRKMQQEVPPPPPPPTTTTAVAPELVEQSNRKRPHEEFEFDENWMHKRDFPPHLVDLVQKVMEMMADDIQFTEGFHKTIDHEVSLPNSALGKGPITKVSESDVVGGTTKYTKMICELFYRLKNYPNSAAPWLASIINCHGGSQGNGTAAITAAAAAAATALKTSEHTASPMDVSDNRVALEEPDESSGLL